MKLTAEYVRQVFDYENGQLRWKADSGRTNSFAGKVAGCRNGDGRYYIRLDDRLLRRSRLIHIWHFGEIPEGYEIDHINGNNQDDRIENLRIASHAENMLNTKNRNNLTGVKGVYYDKRDGKFYARGPRNKHLGTFKTIEEAIHARTLYMRTHYPEFSND